MSGVEKLDILMGNDRLTESRLDFNLTSEKFSRHTGETNSQENAIRTTSENTNDLRSEMNSRISQGLNGLMSTANTQVQKTLNEAIDTQVLPQVQNTMKHVQVVNGDNRNVHAEKSECRSEDKANAQFDRPSVFQKDTLQENRGEFLHLNVNLNDNCIFFVPSEVEKQIHFN